MTYTPHWLLAFGGHSGHSQEQWTCGIRLVEYSVQFGGGIDPDEYLTDVADPALQTWFSNSGTMVHDGARMQWIKFNKIGADGTYEETGPTRILPVNYSGGKSGSQDAHPLQVSYCTSFRTDAITRGKASKGRIYVPRPVCPVDVNGDIALLSREAAANTMATLLNTLDVTIQLGGYMRPSIVSRGTAPTFADEGPYNEINSVIVDSALDIQRRRAMQQSREQHNRVEVTY